MNMGDQLQRYLFEICVLIMMCWFLLVLLSLERICREFTLFNSTL